MKPEEIEYIQLTFQIHSLISDNKDSEEARRPINDRMEVLEATFDDQTQSLLNNVSSYCYALTAAEGITKERYKELLFADTTDPDKLDEMFAKSYKDKEDSGVVFADEATRKLFNDSIATLHAMGHFNLK